VSVGEGWDVGQARSRCGASNDGASGDDGGGRLAASWLGRRVDEHTSTLAR
jgi:hypothetical protein